MTDWFRLFLINSDYLQWKRHNKGHVSFMNIWPKLFKRILWDFFCIFFYRKRSRPMVFGLEKWSWLMWCWSSTLQSWRYHEPERHWLHKNVQRYVKLHYFSNNLLLFYFNLKLIPKFIAQYFSKLGLFSNVTYLVILKFKVWFTIFFSFPWCLSKKMKCLIMIF